MASSGGVKSFTTVPVFVDTNVAIYALGRDSGKKARALELLADTPIASSQVINETLSVLMGKQGFSRQEAYDIADALMHLMAVAPVTEGTVRDAMSLGLRYGLNHWDALIVATALTTGCHTLYTEDMQDEQVFDARLTVKNPFVANA